VREQAALDQVTGRSFLVRIRNDGASEILTVTMEAQASVSGEHYRVTILEVGNPVALDDPSSFCQGY
jgi:hypothetical protein